jgi:hypothetical protein
MDEVEPLLRERRNELSVELAPEAGLLHRAAAHEVGAWRAVWRGEFDRGVDLGKRVLDTLAGDAVLAPYRALWAFFTASWASVLSEQDASYGAVAADLMEVAKAAARGSTWLARIGSEWQPNDEDLDVAGLEALDGAVSHFIDIGTGARKFERLASEVEELLGQTAAGPFEQGLEKLGYLLGFESERFADDAAPDCLWRVPSLWIAWEAKSDESPDGGISVRTIRQANTHLRWCSDHHGLPIPDGSFAMVASPRRSAEPEAEAVANEELFRVTASEVQELARNAVAAWRAARGQGVGASEESLREVLRTALWNDRCTSIRLWTRLKLRPISR